MWSCSGLACGLGGGGRRWVGGVSSVMGGDKKGSDAGEEVLFTALKNSVILG